MERDFGNEIDTLRCELQRLSQLIEKSGDTGKNSIARPSNWYLRENTIKTEEAQLHNGTFKTGKRARELKKYADEMGWTGAIDSISTYSTSSNEYFTDLLPISTDDLLKIENDVVARVLSTLASKQRIAILKAILAEPLSASEILEKLNMGTTGQVYHHINSLLSTDLIQQENGKYVFKGHRVHSLLLFLAGVRDILDEKYSKGDWSVEVEPRSNEASE